MTLKEEVLMSVGQFEKTTPQDAAEALIAEVHSSIASAK